MCAAVWSRAWWAHERAPNRNTVIRPPRSRKVQKCKKKNEKKMEKKVFSSGFWGRENRFLYTAQDKSLVGGGFWYWSAGKWQTIRNGTLRVEICGVKASFNARCTDSAWKSVDWSIQMAPAMLKLISQESQSSEEFRRGRKLLTEPLECPLLSIPKPQQVKFCFKRLWEHSKGPCNEKLSFRRL